MKLIVEMEMPVKEWNCLDCKAICADLMRGHYCGITKKTIDTLKNMRARPDWCPIKGVLHDEHGDLVDKETAKNAFDSSFLTFRMKDGETMRGFYQRTIDELPVLIAAERRSDGKQ